MKIALLTEFPELYSTRRLIETGQTRGHDVDIIRTLQVVISIETGQPTLVFEMTTWSVRMISTPALFSPSINRP